MIPIKNDNEIEKIRISCQIVAVVLEELRVKVKPGVTTLELDQFAEKSIRSRGGTPAFKGYRGFKGTLCTSINEEVVHGIPSERVLNEGDIISIDCGVLHDGFYGDSALTVPVGKIDKETQHLLDVTEKSLELAIEAAQPGHTVKDLGRAVQKYVEGEHFSIVRNFVGHGIGRELHEEPQIPNYVTPGDSPVLKAGMVVAIEPMVNAGGEEILLAEDGWTAFTKDGKRSAHFEHTIAITDQGPLVLTERNK